MLVEIEIVRVDCAAISQEVEMYFFEMAGRNKGCRDVPVPGCVCRRDSCVGVQTGVDAVTL